MRRQLTYILHLLCSYLLLVGCSTLQSNSTSNPTSAIKELCPVGDPWLSTQILQLSQLPEHRTVSAELYLEGTQLSTRVDLFVDREQGMMLSARPLPFLEAIRIYILPDHISIYDMMHEVKVSFSYYELSKRLEAQISYTLLRDLILGEPTYLLGREYSLQGHSLITQLDPEGGRSWLATYKVNSQCQLEAIRIFSSVNAITSSLEGRYSYNLGATKSNVVQLVVSTSKKHLSMTMNYNRIQPISSEQLRDRISEPQGGYSTITLEQFFKAL
jgi:hypothetical protein